MFTFLDSYISKRSRNSNEKTLCCASYRLCQAKFACSTISFHTIHTQQKLLENDYLREYDNSVSWFHRRKSNWKFKNKREISVRNLSVSSLFVKFSGMASDIPTPLLWFSIWKAVLLLAHQFHLFVLNVWSSESILNWSS